MRASNYILNNDFRNTSQSQKLAVVVELLMGDIPDRSIFRQTIMRKTLAPYLQLTQGFCSFGSTLLSNV